MKGEIFIVTGSGQGHLSPCLELCKRLSIFNYKTTLVVPSTISSVPDITQHPLISTFTISSTPGPPMPDSSTRLQAERELETHLSDKTASSLPLCAIIDFQLGWTKQVFWKFGIPAVGFFTFGACAAAMEWAAWKSSAHMLKPGEVVALPGLPDEMKLSHSDIQRRPAGPPRGAASGPTRTADKGGRPSSGQGMARGPGGGPPKPGEKPVWVFAVEGSVGLMFNTSPELERPFLDYMEKQMGMPVWGVGPLLPEQFWDSISGSVKGFRSLPHNRQTNYTENEVIQWLDTKPRGSVLYVAFGSEASLSFEELTNLAEALKKCSYYFIWAIQSKPGIESYSPPAGLENSVGNRGLIIRGWAPQLVILSHSSIRGFLSHCGWNSTAEAMGLGVPILAWPLRGDQYFNAMLAVKHLKVGCMAMSGDGSKMVQKEDILKGIEKLMGGVEMETRAKEIRAMFEKQFPSGSKAALQAFGNFISNQNHGKY